MNELSKVLNKRYGNVVEHAGSGFALPESLARKIDELSKGLPRDFTYRRKGFETVNESLDGSSRTEVSVITTDCVDRDGDVVLSSGGDWSTFNKVVPFCHKYDQLPAGSCLWVKAVARVTRAKTHYPTAPPEWDGPWLPSAIWHFINQTPPTMGDKSIGFLPKNVRHATGDELAKRPDLRGRPIIDKWVGLEYSVVAVPCNPEARLESIGKSLLAGAFDSATGALLTKLLGIDGAALAFDEREAKIKQLLATPVTVRTEAEYLAAQRREAIAYAKKYAEAYVIMKSGRV